jgi:hypothetical protein
VTAMDFSKEFKLVVDVSGVSVEAVLLQEGKDKIGLSICYFSKKLDKHQKIILQLRKNVLLCCCF